MKPDWDKLMQEARGSKHTLVADVDCTKQVNKKWCDDLGVQGYPTLKFGNPEGGGSAMAVYTPDRGRSLEALREFVKQELGPNCLPDGLDRCNPFDRGMVEDYMKMSRMELQRQVDDVQHQIDKTNEKYTAIFKSIEERFAAGERKKHQDIQRAKDANVGFMRSVMAWRHQQERLPEDQKEKPKAKEERDPDDPYWREPDPVVTMQEIRENRSSWSNIDISDEEIPEHLKDLHDEASSKRRDAYENAKNKPKASHTEL